MFDVYLALGDSMSIDFYPAQDAERAGLSTREDIGASALLYRNDSVIFPEFVGQDLVTWFPGIRYMSLAFDGATCEDLLSDVRAKEISARTNARVLVTLTLGGNDLLNSHRRSLGRDQSTLLAEFATVQKRYEAVINMIRNKLPNSVLILSTVFDPTDGTGIMPSTTPLYEAPLPIEDLTQFNRFVISCAQDESILAADVHKHFRGHGAECGAAEQFWYWRPSPIEPSYRGASEIRRVWLQLLEPLTSKNA